MPAQRCRHRDGRTQLRQLKAGRKAQQQHSSPGAVRLHSQNAHSSALLARWARPMCTAVTARSGAPFAQTVSLLQRTPASRRIPAPKGAITCSPAQRRKILSSASRGSNPRERRQQVNDIGARANGLLKHACKCSGLSSGALSSRPLGSCRSRCCCSAAAANLFRPCVGTRLLLLPRLYAAACRLHCRRSRSRGRDEQARLTLRLDGSQGLQPCPKRRPGHGNCDLLPPSS